MQKVAKKVQKTHITESYIPIKISRKKLIAKMTSYMPKAVMRPKTKSQGFKEVITPVGYGLVGRFVFQCNQDSFLGPPLKETVFVAEDEWCFQQDFEPPHKVKRMQKWLQEHVPDFMEVDDWPSSILDFNPLDYKLWLVLEKRACAQRHQTLDPVKAMREISMVMICKPIDHWPKHLRRCVQAKGGHFE